MTIIDLLLLSDESCLFCPFFCFYTYNLFLFSELKIIFLNLFVFFYIRFQGVCISVVQWKPKRIKQPKEKNISYE